MSIKRAHVGVVVAILAAAGAGFVVARATSPSASAPADAQADEDKAVHVKGFVALKPADAPAAGVELAQVERGGGIDLLLPGRVAVAVNAQSVVAAPLDGTIVDIHVAVGSKVAKGAAVASIRSPEGGAIRAEVDAAKAALEAAEALDVRNKHLFDEGVIPRQEWEATRAATLTAQAQVRAAESQAAAMGAPTTRGVAVIRSPISGVVTRIPATPGSSHARAPPRWLWTRCRPACQTHSSCCLRSRNCPTAICLRPTSSRYRRETRQTARQQLRVHATDSDALQ